MRILFIIPYQFVPPNVGNKTLLYNLLKYVSNEANCDLAILVDDITKAAEIESDVRREYPSVCEIKIFGKPRSINLLVSRFRMLVKGFHPALGRFSSKKLGKWLTAQTDRVAYDLIHFDMIHTAYYRRFCNSVPSLLVASDAYSMAARDSRIVSRNIKTRLRAPIDYMLLRNFERKEYPGFNMVCTVSERDAKYLREVAPIALIRTIGIAVASEYACRELLWYKRSTEKPVEILCTGSLNHEIIAGGIIDFLNLSLPIIRRRYPDLNVTILGKNPMQNLERCINETAGVRHVEYVQDYADYLDQGWVYVYPQKAATGLQTKVQQAMALGLPVVGFDVSFGGLAVESGRHCFICDGIEEMTSYVERLVGDQKLRVTIGKAAAEHIMERFSIEAIGKQMFLRYSEAILQGVTRKK